MKRSLFSGAVRRLTISLVAAGMLGGVLGGSVLGPGPVARAEGCAMTGPIPERITNDHDRFRLVEEGGDPFTVLLPPGYDPHDAAHRYPVLYLLHGALDDHTSWLAETDLYDFTADARNAPVIVVMPNGDPDGFWIDWRNGAYTPDRYTVTTLIPYVDAHFNTIADRRHRAIAGLSGGGGGAAVFAARHPDLVGALAAFSAGWETVAFARETTGEGAYDAGRAPVLDAVGLATTACAGNDDPFGMCGGPSDDPAWCAGYDPLSLLANYSDTAIDIYVGDGAPCDPDDVVTMATQDPTKSGEAAIFVVNQDMHRALAAAGVEHRYHAYGCGIHSWRYWQRDLHEWWPLMSGTFAGTA
jgi:S-formylglutathione hydrolase FrmB